MDLIAQQFDGHPFAGRRGIRTRADSSNKVQVVACSDGSVPFEGFWFLKPRSRLPPLFRWAASHGVKASVELYVRRGYDVNATDIRGRTLLLLAAAGGYADICRLLIEAGADPSLRDVNGLDALSAAVESKKEKAAAVLRTCLSAAAVSLGDPAAAHSSTAGVVSEAGVAIAAGEDESPQSCRLGGTDRIPTTSRQSVATFRCS